MQIEAIYGICQSALVGICLAGIAACVAVPLVPKVGAVLEKAWRDYLHLDGFGKVVVLCGVCLSVLFGGSKGFWGKVAHGGGDAEFQVVGIYTAVSNVVDDTVSPPVTNHVPMVRIEWLGDGATADTPVGIRATEQEEWQDVEKIDPVVTVESITNVLEFATATNLSNFAYWWFGEDRPAIIVIEEGIEIREVEITTKRVRFAWVCGETEAEEFVIRRRKVGTSDWVEVGRVPAIYGKVNKWEAEMFTVDTDYDWQIMTTIEEGGTEE